MTSRPLPVNLHSHRLTLQGRRDGAPRDRGLPGRPGPAAGRRMFDSYT